MDHTCKNCQNRFSGSYCNHCGQSADTEDIQFKYILKELRKTFIRFDGGFFYTAKTLLTKPGYTIKGFIEGKRVRHLKPFSFLVVTAGLYAFFYNYFHINPFGNNSGEIDTEKLNTWVSSNYVIVQLIGIPMFALGSLLAFGWKTYNYFEFIIINTYITGQRLLIGLALIPLFVIYNGRPEIRHVDNLNLIVLLSIYLWVYGQIFTGLPWWSRTLRILIAIVLTVLQMTAVLGVSLRLSGLM